MLDASRARILDRLGPDDLVLDVGGGADPFPRADWVMDLIGYDQRERPTETDAAGPGEERFTAETWVTGDICDRDPWPFADDQFDFAICSHTLEDIRDPISVCRELTRVARAGYIETPSRLEEQSYGVHGPWAGWSHHRWLIDADGDELVFVFKSAMLTGRSTGQFPEAFWDGLSAEERTIAFWWEGSLRARERVILDAEEHDAYLLEPLIARGLHPAPTPAGGRSGSGRWFRSRRGGP